MTSGKPKSSYLVKFSQSEADQELLQWVDRALSHSAYKGFSDLCKQALRLLSSTGDGASTLPLLALLEQQIMTLQLQVMQLEQRSTLAQSNIPSSNATQSNPDLLLQIQQLTDRLNQLEQKLAADEMPVEAEAPEPEPDPLLERLAPFLEDF